MADAQNMSIRQLAALLRQYRKARRDIICCRGHEACGCTTVSSYRSAPCSIEVADELRRRRRCA